MAYKAHNFEDGKVLTAAQLNEMDEQIVRNMENSGAKSWNFSADYQAEIDNVVNVVSEIQGNAKKHTIEFIAFTDLHKNTVAEHPEFDRMIQAIDYLTHTLNIRFVASLGDNIDTPIEGSNYGAGAYGVYEQLHSALDSLNAPYISVTGNHDWIPHIYKRNWATNMVDAVFDSVGAWFYVDDSKHSIRFVVLDCSDRGNDANAWTSITTASSFADRSWKQLDWLANTALKTSRKIIFISHQSLGSTTAGVVASPRSANYDIASTIVKAFEAGTAGSANYTKTYSDETTAHSEVEWDFTEQGAGTVLFNIHGHSHGDIFVNPNYTTVSTVSSPFNEIAVDDALYSNTNYIGKANTKTMNTVNEIAFDVVSVDLIEGIVRCYRFGAGQNRICTLGGSVTYESFPAV